jgi:type IV pilus assembly protein PilN
MARINLLPWRAERRKQRQKEFMAMLGLSALAAVVLSFLLVNYYSRQIDGQNERNQFLEQRIAQVQKQIDEIKTLDEKKARLLKRKEIIEDLQADRSQMVHLFDSLVRTIPDGVVLTSIKQEGDKLSLEGRSQSNARVSAYMRSLEGSGWMTQPQLSIIEAKEGDPGLPFTFSMSVTLANPNAPKDADGDGKPDEAPAAAPAAGQAPAAAPAAAPSNAGAAS